ncbi:MAG: class I SAM-dependent methyltransferase [Myxococcota bacterium]
MSFVPTLVVMERYDWNGAADDYARFRAGFPARLFEELEQRRLLRTPALDVGAGTGAIALELARRGMQVEAIDAAEAPLGFARAKARRLGCERRIRFRRATAEHPGVEPNRFELVVAGQCWHWFRRKEAARALRRALRPGGALIIAHLDWLVEAGGVVEASLDLIERHLARSSRAFDALTVRGLYPYWLEDLRGADFGRIESFSFDGLIPYTGTSWRGRFRASSYVGARRDLDADARAACDRALENMLDAEWENLQSVPHRVFVALGRKPESREK